MPYKYQGFGAGPITRKAMAGLIAFVVGAIVVYISVAWWLLLQSFR